MGANLAKELNDLGSAQRAYELIRAGIIEGRYRPGQRMVEQRIGEEYALSRTPVREALHTLEAEGLIISERNRGAVVRPVSADDIYDLYELRARLESYAVERAADRATEADLRELDDAIAAFDRAIFADSISELEQIREINRANARFHGALMGMAHHARLAQLLVRTVDIPLVFQAFRVFDKEERERSNLFHRFIREAVSQGEGTRAGSLMSEHIAMGRDVLVRRIEEAAHVAHRQTTAQ
jgi:DNA-binding GntR family transcriptional regulator